MCFSARRSSARRHSPISMCPSSSLSPILPASFHLSASILALVALVGAYSSVDATAAAASPLGIRAPIESSMAMYYQPGVANVADLCPPDYDGAYIAAGCQSIIWCADGMLKFQAGCPEEGQLFDDTCLCCRDANGFECRVEATPQVVVEEQAAVVEVVEEEEEEKVEEEDSAAIITDNLTSDQVACVRCTNIPTEYMMRNDVSCATYEHAFTRRCGTEYGWWGRNGNPEHCQYSCWENGVPYSTQRGKPCCYREDTDDLELAAKLLADVDSDTTAEGPIIAAVDEQPGDEVAPPMAAVCEAGFTGLTTNADCTSISVCNDGELAYSMDCPTGTLFDDNSKQCVKWHRQFVCTKSQMKAGTVETIENNSECPRGASGLHPLPDCIGYNVCFLGTKLFVTPCTSGTLFNVNTQQCQRWHRGFVCGGTPNTRAEAPTTAAFTPTSVPTAGPTASPTKEPTPAAEPLAEVQLDSQVPAIVSPEGICPAGLTGFIPTPDCKGSNVCRNGVFKYAIECKDGHLFDSDKGRCVKWHRKFVCGGDSEEVEEDSSNGEELPSPTGAPTGSPTRAPVAYACPEDYTGMVATTGCRGSYVCRAGKYLMGPIACPSGTLFDEAMGICVDRSPWFVCVNSATEAGTRAQTTESPTSSLVEEDIGPCQSGFTGLAPTEQCTGAHVCRDGDLIMSMDCPGGSLFDANIQQCVPWYRSFVCGDVAADSTTSEVELKGAGKGKKSEKEDIVPDEAKAKKGEKDDESQESRDQVSMDTVELPVPPPTPPIRPRSRCPRGFSGRVPANEACSAYIYCERGEYDNQGVVNCRPDQFVFDFLTQKCVMPFRSFECMYTILTTDEEAIAQELIAQVKTGKETVSDGEEEITQETLAKVEIQSVPLSGGSGAGNGIRA